MSHVFQSNVFCFVRVGYIKGIREIERQDQFGIGCLNVIDALIFIASGQNGILNPEKVADFIGSQHIAIVTSGINLGEALVGDQCFQGTVFGIHIAFAVPVHVVIHLAH